jgi:type I restriction enzyme S subunit
MAVVIPSEWEKLPISSVGELSTGTTPPTEDRSLYGDEYPFISPADLGSQKYIRKAEKNLSAKGFLGTRQIPKGSLLFVCIGSTIGKTGITTKLSSCNQQINYLVPYEKYHTEYVYYALNMIAPLVKEQAGEQAVPMVNKSEFAKFTIPVPKLNEQVMIAKALSDIDELISELELEIKKLEDFKLSQIYLILNPDSLIKNGIITQSYLLSNIANFSKGRGQNKGNLIESGDFPCILYGELFTTYGEIIDTVVSKSSINEGLSSVSGDVLIPGSTTTVGRDLATASVIKQNGVLLGGDINIIRFNDLKTVLPDYFAYLFKYILVDQVEQMAQGTTIKHLYGKDIIKLSIDLPPIDYQAQAIRNLSITETRISSAKSEMKKYECIKQGMAHDLLTGKVRLV